MALPTRLSNTWRSRPASPTRPSGTSDGTWQTSSSPFRWARTARARRVSPTAARRWKSATSSSSLPASILEKSSRSLIMPSRLSAADLTVFRYCRWSSVRGVSRARSVMPRMAFMGVRISWLTLARNSSLARFAASARSIRALVLHPRALRSVKSSTRRRRPDCIHRRAAAQPISTGTRLPSLRTIFFFSNGCTLSLVFSSGMNRERSRVEPFRRASDRSSCKRPRGEVLAVGIPPCGGTLRLASRGSLHRHSRCRSR